MRCVGAICALAGLVACGGGGGPPPPDPSPLPPEQAESQSEQPIFAACGTPTIDGILSPGEWDGAIPVRFRIWLQECGNTFSTEIPADIMARSDDQNLYVALRLGSDLSASPLELTVQLAGNGSHRAVVSGDGDDVLSFSWEPGVAGGPAQFEDFFGWACLTDDAGSEPQLCTTPDTEGWRAGLLSGTTDGGGAIHHGDGETTIELWHPYTGADPRDVGVGPGDDISLGIALTVTPQCGTTGYFPQTSYYPSSLGYRSFVLGACTAPPPQQQMIDAGIGTPGQTDPFIDFGFNHAIPVTLLGSAALDVTHADPSRLYFDGAPVTVPYGTRVEDVNGDGIDDLVAEFWSDDLNSSRSNPSNQGGWYGAYIERELTVAGRTREGRRFYGTVRAELMYPPPPP